MTEKKAIKKAREKLIEQLRSRWVDSMKTLLISNEAIDQILTDLVDEIKKESAWEMFRRLSFDTESNFFPSLIETVTGELYDPQNPGYQGWDATSRLLNMPEKEAIEIMRQIEKELEEGK